MNSFQFVNSTAALRRAGRRLPSVLTSFGTGATSREGDKTSSGTSRAHIDLSVQARGSFGGFPFALRGVCSLPVLWPQSADLTSNETGTSAAASAVEEEAFAA